MAKTRNILKRAQSVRGIRGVTKTMEMVATTRFKKVHDLAVGSRPYTDKLMALAADLVARGATGRVRHPLMFPRKALDRAILLVITSDRGLCGGYNASVLRTGLERREQLIEAGHSVLLQVVGKQGATFLRERGIEIDKQYTDISDVPEYNLVALLADLVIESFLAGEVDSLEIAYTQFLSAGSQKPAIAEILPMPAPEVTFADIEDREERPHYDFIPSPHEVLGELLPATVRLRTYQCFLDSAVSEHVMRLTAMRSASESADEMIGDLTRRYNRLRQSQITTELAEIMGGRVGVQ